jgi:3-deoxy-D-manno-octulosonic-acid transferase
MRDFKERFLNRLILFVYQMITALYAFVIWGYLCIRAIKQPAYLRFWRERLGWVVFAKENYLVKDQVEIFWIHAVSVGEARSIKPLIDLLLSEKLSLKIVLTHHTPTARSITQEWTKQWPNRLFVRYSPYDLKTGYRIFLHQIQKIGQLKACLLIENQVWPNLTYFMSQQQIPVWVINGRYSEKSFVKTKKFPVLWRLAQMTFDKITWVGAQSKQDAQRFSDLGAQRVQVMRNLKFDISVNTAQMESGNQVRQYLWSLVWQRVWLLASSREGEEAALLKAYQHFLEQQQGEMSHLLVIVPRHPQRFKQVAQEIEQAGFVCVRASSLNLADKEKQWDLLCQVLDKAIGSAQAIKKPLVLLGDDLGRMAFWYAVSDAVMMGGTWGRFGGQNLIEPLQQGKPVWMGVHTENFEEVSDRAVEAGVAYRITEGFVQRGDIDDLSRPFFNALIKMDETLKQWDQNPKRWLWVRENTMEFAEKQKGGTVRLARVLQQLIK